MQDVLVKLLNKAAMVPTKATDGSACFDLYSAGVTQDSNGWTVHTGLSVAVPENHVMLIFPRSGLSSKNGFRLRNGIGVIDSDYRGEILLKFTPGDGLVSDGFGLLSSGNRVAQAMIVELPQAQMCQVDSLPETARGTGGFGSTG
jgi:dUTP pyrophosphatase